MSDEGHPDGPDGPDGFEGAVGDDETAARALFEAGADPAPSAVPPAEPDPDVTAAHVTFSAPPPEYEPAPAVEDVGEDGEDDEDDEDERKGLSFGTKALIVLAAWILLVLFFVGQFTGDDEPLGPDPVNLDQAGGTTIVGDEGTGEESAAEEPVDVDGDGEIEPGEPGFATAANVAGASASGSGAEGGSGSGGSSGGGTGGGSVGVSTVPPSGGGGGSSGSTTTTKKPAGGATTTTTQQGGGGGGGGSSSTTAPATTTTANESVPDPVTVTVDKKTSGSEFSTPAVNLVRGQAIRFVNADDNTGHELDVPGPTNLILPKGESRTVTFPNAGVFTIECDTSGSDHTGTLTVTVT